MPPVWRDHIGGAPIQPGAPPFTGRTLADAALARAQAARPDKQVSAVLANREYEAWFLAAAPSLAGQFGFPAEFARPQNPEAPRDCKGLLPKARPKGQPYKETVDQAPLTSVFDLKMAREHSDSFDKFYREVSRLLGIC